MMTEFRKLASIRKVDEKIPIQGADNIETIVVDGWKVVVKKGEFQVGEVAVYFEIDSWVPTNIAPFLSKGKPPKEYKSIKGERLTTAKFRGQLSQGLLLPITILGENFDCTLGRDVTEELGIQKYESLEILANSSVRTKFPLYIPKTDQERIQNLKNELSNWKNKNLKWEVTEKLDGTSMTIYMMDNIFGVCSRNFNLIEDPKDIMWNVARKMNIEEKLKGKNIALQGELIGVKIQKNRYNIHGTEFRLFDIYDIDERRYLNAFERGAIAEQLELKHCPVIGIYTFSDDETVETLLDMADGKSSLNNTEREGLVFKCVDEHTSFKVISNKFLLKNN